MLHTGGIPQSLSEEDLRQAIEHALNNINGAKFIYDPEKLLEKLEKHGVSIQDLLCVCRGWEVFRSTRWERGTWRYRIEGYNSDKKWMAAVLSVTVNPTVVVAITGFRYSKGRRKP